MTKILHSFLSSFTEQRKYQKMGKWYRNKTDWALKSFNITDCSLGKQHKKEPIFAVFYINRCVSLGMLYILKIYYKFASSDLITYRAWSGLWYLTIPSKIINNKKYVSLWKIKLHPTQYTKQCMKVIMTYQLCCEQKSFHILGC